MGTGHSAADSNLHAFDSSLQENDARNFSASYKRHNQTLEDSGVHSEQCTVVRISHHNVLQTEEPESIFLSSGAT